MKMPTRSKKGFTLVEIMIVVVIIGLLAAMAIPAFQKVRKNSIGKTMANDARQIAGACQQLLLENPALGTNVNITFDNTTGQITGPAAATGNILQYLQKVSRGYSVATIDYNGAAGANAAAFTLTHPQIGPNDVSSANNTTTIGSAVSFDTEGKAL